jgi:hypothetical protein
MEIRFILNDSEDCNSITPINVAKSIIEFAIKNMPTNTDTEFIRQVSGHLEVFWKGSERERYSMMEEEEL